MRTIDDLKRWKSYGMLMVPSNLKTKQPNSAWYGDMNKDGSKKYTQVKDSTDDELLNAECLAFYHKESNTFTVDFDDPDYVAHGYCSMLPDTFTDGKVVNGSWLVTHKTYKINGAGALKFRYPLDAKGKKMVY